MKRLAILLAILLAVPCAAQKRGGDSAAAAGHETANKLAGVGGSEIDLTTASALVKAGAGGDTVLEADGGTDSTVRAVGLSGQTDSLFEAEEFGGDKMTISADAETLTFPGGSYVEEFSGGKMWLYAPSASSTDSFLLDTSTGRLRIGVASTIIRFDNNTSSSAVMEFLSYAGFQIDIDGGAKEFVIAADASYVEVKGCRDYGTLTAAPTPSGACDRYYDDSGAFCVYNGSTWDKIGSGTCV